MPYPAHSAELNIERVGAVVGWYDAHARDLPWRRADCSAWGVLVSEVMLQQTPVSRVLPAWEGWMARWPTPADLASASQADAVRAWERLGYPRRAKRLWECAAALVDRHAGEVPDDAEALLALPGVGDYTASAVLAFAFGRSAVVLDTNVRRVIGRAWHGEPLPATSLGRAERDAAAAIVPIDHADAAKWAAASMELGALVCTARSPRCEECPLADMCVWKQSGGKGLDLAPRRTQAWHGTDRQVRGRVLALLRDSPRPVNISGSALLDDVAPGQLDRCLAGLIADGLVALENPERGSYALA
ncbi:A/G-specific adenine glycosylase [Demequina sp. TTPB684]|uniref:A/G-specific adenine glycosylase n=1 Tax=unclassified Demequina TaxID=2620311 RepID=UPI001CF5BBCA|nr:MULTISPECIES: A/G-specific adenine glycosylase [unclassified Demequina]MCB2413236.1 A/G-specific adenine glycosylase [Demequina sp. TTPB684]UPU88189.1 A/G-specific adenine glycosylase [Demequina sp. TMPB413]